MRFKIIFLVTALLLFSCFFAACRSGFAEHMTVDPGNAVQQEGDHSLTLTLTTPALTTPALTPSFIPSLQPSASPSATPSAIPDFTWGSILNAAYSNEHAAEGTAQLSDGVMSQNQPGGGAVYFQLSHLRLFADLNADEAQDALVFLLIDAGGPGTLFYLYPVINRNGLPEPGVGRFLGKGVFLRSLTVEEGEIRLVMDAIGSRDYACCPKDSQQLTFRLDGDTLLLEETLDLPDRQVGGRPEAQPRRLMLEPGAGPMRIENGIGFNQIDSYRFEAADGQMLNVNVDSPAGDVVFSIFGEDGGQALASFLDGTTAWSGRLPTDQDYLLQVVALGGETSYSLDLALDEPFAGGFGDIPPPGWVQQNGQQKVLYLTFDDGPSPTWTPRLLEVLARYGARATFFALAEEIQKNPQTTAAILAAGHSIGNHSATHQTFEGITRYGFQREVGALQALLHGEGAACLRPPYGAIDAYTRLYAAELGYRTVLWDVDPQDWRRPGVTVITQHVMDAVEPGDILLLHDSGGDRSQTVLALEIILKTLREEGYAFGLICR